MFEIKRYTKVTSTNDIVKELANGGAPEWTVVIADEQTAGRGRMGRSFFSPQGTGVYMSVLLRPEFAAEKSLFITTATAVAVAKTIEKYTDKSAKIKWVNDVYLDGKKVCGILTEGKICENSLEYAVLGIGINLEKPKDGFFELENIAGAVFNGGRYDKDAFCKEILHSFFEYYQKLEDIPHHSEYVARDMLVGEEVDILRAGETLGSAKVCGIDENFSLIIEKDGKKELLASGEVSVKKQEKTK